MAIRNLQREVRMPLHFDSEDQTYYTPEGYLIDHPIVTRVGIFTYHNPDGSVRKEFRPPEEVFAPESLASFKGKPVIITHDAGRIDIDNVADEEIGTILSEGYKDGNNVKCEIVIQDVKSLKDSGLRELSLGYNLELDETPGEWNGEHYDAVQRDIRINHLALVKDARAGDSARLNIDSKDSETIVYKKEGDSSMKRHDSESVNPDELQKKIDGFVEANGGVGDKNADKPAAKADAEDAPATQTETPEEPEAENKDAKDAPAAPAEPEAKAEEPEAPVQADSKNAPAADTKKDPKAIIQAIREKFETNKDGDDPTDLDAAKKLITDCRKDCATLFDCIDKLDAANDMKEAAPTEETNDNPDAAPVAEPEAKVEEPEAKAEAPAEENKDADDDEDDIDGLNTDSVDRRVRERVKVLRVGDKLHMDGLEDMSLIDAKKAIIKKVNPKMNFDGKSKMYINSAYDFVLDNVISMKKDADYQRAQMRGFGMNLDSKDAPGKTRTAADARAEMIQNMDKRGGNE